MNTNNKSTFNYIEKYSLADNFFFNNQFQIQTFDKLIINMRINISLNEETAVIFPRTIWLLEHMSGQKPFVKNLKTKRIGRNQRRIYFSTSVTLRNNKMLSFIYFYNCFLIKTVIKRLVFYNRKINKFDGNYSFTIKNINVFPGYLEDFFKWPYFVNFNFVLRNYDVNVNKTILQNLGIWTI
jgi:ribosomal protein L5